MSPLLEGVTPSSDDCETDCPEEEAGGESGGEEGRSGVSMEEGSPDEAFDPVICTGEGQELSPDESPLIVSITAGRVAYSAK